jgi:hypothetical protein
MYVAIHDELVEGKAITSSNSTVLCLHTVILP